MRCRPFGRTWMRKRRMNSCVANVMVVVRPGPSDPVVLDLEGDAARIGADQALVGDGDAMGIAG